jgi:hypothetical protein
MNAKRIGQFPLPVKQPGHKKMPPRLTLAAGNPIFDFYFSACPLELHFLEE